MLALSGLVVAGIYGFQALGAYEVMQRVESSSAVTVAKGLGLLARLFPPAGAIGQLIDPRNQQLYVHAQEQLAQGVGVGAVGLLIALVGLISAAVWHPTVVPAGVVVSRNPASALAGIILVVVGGFYLLNMVGGNVSALGAAARALSAPTGQLAAPITQPLAEGIAPGTTTPPGVLPMPTTAPPPSAVFYRADPFGPVKVNAGSTYTVRLGSLRQNTIVRAVATIEFNSRASALTGVPDVTIAVSGPTGIINTLSRARSGAQISFQTPADGDYAIVLDNTYSRVTAKQISLQFLRP